MRDSEQDRKTESLGVRRIECDAADGACPSARAVCQSSPVEFL